MTQAPTLTGQDIGQAEHAIRAVLERLLAQTGTSFHSWVALNLLGNASQALTEGELAARMAGGLKIPGETARAAIGDLAGQALLHRGGDAADPPVSLTPAGAARFRQVRDGIAGITERLYGGLPAGDLAAARRVLATVTERANAELAG